MRTARPAARPPHPFFELRAHPFDMLPPCLLFLDGDSPADPLVARERRYVFPGRQCLRVGRERLAEISRKVMYDSPGDSNRCHRAIPQARGSSIRCESATRIGGNPFGLQASTGASSSPRSPPPAPSPSSSPMQPAEACPQETAASPSRFGIPSVRPSSRRSARPASGKSCNAS